MICNKEDQGTFSHENQDLTVQEQGFEQAHVRNIIVQDDQNHKPQIIHFPEQIPMQNPQHLLAKCYIEHSTSHQINYKTYHKRRENDLVDVYWRCPSNGNQIPTQGCR